MIDVQEAAGQITALLQTIPADVMPGFPEGEVPEDLPTPPNDPRVLAYWVLWAGPGAATPTALAAYPLVKVLRFTVTVAGGTKDRTLGGVEKVRKALSGKEIASGLISEDEFDPGTLRRDDTVSPPRHFVPIQFVLEP